MITLLLLVVVVPVSLWVLLSLPGVQNIVRERAEKELTALLGSDVAIGRVSIAPFNSVTLYDVSVKDDRNVEALNVERLGAGIELGKFLFDREIVVSYAELVGMHANLYRDSVGAPLNILPIIDRLTKKDPNKPPTSFDLAINIAVVRKSTVDYNVKSVAQPAEGKFSSDHIQITELEADIMLPRISNDNYVVDVRRLAMRERSGFVIEQLSAAVDVTPESFVLRGFELRLPRSYIGLSDIIVNHGGAERLKSDWKSLPLSLSLAEGSTVTPADFSTFVGSLSGLDKPLSLGLKVSGTPADFDVSRFEVSLPSLPFGLTLEGRVTGLPDGIENTTINIPALKVNANAAALPELLKNFMTPSQTLLRLFSSLGEVALDGHAELNPASMLIATDLTSSAGDIKLEARIDRRANKIDGHLASERIDLSGITPDVPLSVTALDAKVENLILGKSPSGHILATVGNAVYKNLSIEDIELDATATGEKVEGKLNTAGALGRSELTAAVDIAGEKSLTADLSLEEFNLEALGAKLPGNLRGKRLTGDMAVNVAGHNFDDVVGAVSVENLLFAGNGQQITPGNIVLTAANDSVDGRHIKLVSEIVNADFTGHFRPSTLAESVKTILASINPEFFPEGTADNVGYADDMRFELEVSPDSQLFNIFNIGVRPLVPVKLTGSLDETARSLELMFNAPYLRQKDKLIEQSSLTVSLDGQTRRSSLQAYTKFPAKGTQIGLTVASDGVDGVHNTEVSWMNASGHTHGDLRFTTSFLADRDETTGRRGVETLINVNPGQIVFSDTVWTVRPSSVDIRGSQIEVNDFKVSHEAQLLSINGKASRDSTDRLVVTLRDINLDYVFDVLNIPNVMFGGDATGVFYASSLLTSRPVAYTPRLLVKNLAYNNCVMGDGVIQSAWHPDEQTVTIDAVINQSDGTKSYINGSINPVKELLDFRFDANRANVGFLKPFMAAFCDDITGKASGKAHLFGTFKLLDMEGDIYGENLNMTLGITGTTYSATDSVHIRPGRIEINDIILTDQRGKTSKFSGLLTHSSFKEPHFNFTVSDARDFLCYDVPANSEHPWYGKVYGNGSVNISGRPGLVNIAVDMATAPGSEFTFVLSDEEVAAEYDFLTFRDANPARKDSVASEESLLQALIENLREGKAKSGDDTPTDYEMTFNVDVTPDAKIILVMDPVGGDKIRATGNGNLRMYYGSANDELKMYGTYTLNQGFYNFTLQDIIIKDFTIEDGSSITFHGDPYSALLDIRAYYSLNANLSDLDESFLQDRELNRTNVPVHAMLLVSGDMRSPDINFDLEFPTLTQDTYRKVRSIVSTEEMMNRQIIYLLALNRFYTPEYMSATRGNELVSVASSTISSQLSSMLGQLSDKFSIAPTFRSDKGDFSDVEVDVALSSHLLNNRLLLNGTFGYRDKSLNDNSFIGDFDIEYLLNRSGSLRLKAYNRYNDQNYYLKSALTTQGVGIVYKRDFDNIFDFWHRLRCKFNHQKTDSLIITPSQQPDSISPAK